MVAQPFQKNSVSGLTVGASRVAISGPAGLVSGGPPPEPEDPESLTADHFAVLRSVQVAGNTSVTKWPGAQRGLLLVGDVSRTPGSPR